MHMNITSPTATSRTPRRRSSYERKRPWMARSSAAASARRAVPAYGSVEQLHRDEPDRGVGRVLEVVDHRLARRGLGVVGVAVVIFAGDHYPVGAALTADPAVHHRPEVAPGV